MEFMKTYNLIYSSTSGKVEIAPLGARGYVQFLVMSHSESSVQAVELYDGLDNLAARFEISPQSSPASVTYPRERPLWFSNGLQIDTGVCTVNMVVVK
jgi:hypothetical protein